MGISPGCPLDNQSTSQHIGVCAPTRARSLALLGTTADELLFDFEVLTERRLVDYADKRLLFTWQDQVRSLFLPLIGKG